MRLIGRGLRLAAVPALLVLTAPPGPDRALESSIRMLQRAAAPRPDQGHLRTLAALRQLRDPSLRSFFLQLAQQADPAIQVEAIVGLAEIAEDGRVDPWLVARLDDGTYQYRVLDSALARGLIDVRQMEELLRREDLAPAARLLLLAALEQEGRPVDGEALSRLAGDPDLEIAGRAACLLAEDGDDGAFLAYRARLETLTAGERTRHLQGMYRFIANNKLVAVLDWVVDTLPSVSSREETLLQGVSAALALDHERGAAVWSSALGSDPSYSKSVRYALVLLSAWRSATPRTYDRLPEGDRLFECMADAGRALAGGGEPASALIELWDLGQPATMRWVGRVCRELEGEPGSRVLGHVLDGGLGDDSPLAQLEMAFLAAARLFEIDRDAFARRLDAAQDDGPAQQALLMGLLESKEAEAGEMARRVKRVGFGRADSLALIVIAKHAGSLSEQELYQLGIIASGGGDVAPMLQDQAAWLYLRHASKIEQALAATFAAAGTE